MCGSQDGGNTCHVFFSSWWEILVMCCSLDGGEYLICVVLKMVRNTFHVLFSRRWGILALSCELIRSGIRILMTI